MNRNVRIDLNWKNIDTKIEIGFVFLCYAIGMGSILFGSLSGSKYGYHFIVIGILAIVLVVIHTGRRAAQYYENKEKIKENIKV